MHIQTKLHMWWTWTAIAIRNAAAAQRCRRGMVTPNSFESENSASLSLEFEYSISSIAAVAFAMEALSKEIEGGGHNLDESGFEKPTNTTRGFYVALRIVQAFDLEGEVAQNLPYKMNELFHLRNNSVHFESKYQSGVHPHPSGTKTAYEHTIYTYEKSLEAVQLAVEVLKQCTKSAQQTKYHSAAMDAAKAMPGVLAMLEEIIDVEDLQGVE